MAVAQEVALVLQQDGSWEVEKQALLILGVV